jgi:hypothetical protein
MILPLPTYDIAPTLQPSRKRSEEVLERSMDSSVVSNSSVDFLFSAELDVSFRCVLCIIDTFEIQLISANVDILSTVKR